MGATIYHWYCRCMSNTWLPIDMVESQFEAVRLQQQQIFIGGVLSQSTLQPWAPGEVCYLLPKMPSLVVASPIF